MKRGDAEYKALTAILKEELVVATGCTEPISVAYAAARHRVRDCISGVLETFFLFQLKTLR